MMLTIKDTALFYLEGYIHAKVTEHLLQGKVLSSDFDNVKKIVVECMKDYISQLNLTDKEKDELQLDAYHSIPNLKKGLSYDKVCSLR